MCLGEVDIKASLSNTNLKRRLGIVASTASSFENKLPLHVKNMSTTQRFTVDAPTDYDLTDKEKEAEAKAQAAKLRIAGGCLAAYFIIGLIAFAIPGSFEEYSFTDCMYFLMVTLTVCVRLVKGKKKKKRDE